MRDIYLIDFENVASEGLSGITYLSPENAHSDRKKHLQSQLF